MTSGMISGLVSTVIPVYNRSAMLREAVQCVLAQTWRPIEIIIVDDGSTDDTAQTAQDLCRQHPEQIRLLRQPNSGPGAARQRGFEASQGEFIQFLDSDDLLLPQKFEWQVTGLRGDPQAGISYGKTYVRVNGQRLGTPSQSSGVKRRTIFPTLLGSRLWETSTPLYRRSALARIGPWSDRRQLEDWEFDCRAGAAGILLHYCEEYVAEHVHHDQGRLSSLWLTDRRAMMDRISAHIAVLAHARTAGLAADTPEMQTFARSLFWMARSAGSYGLPQEAQTLFMLAQSINQGHGWDYRLFKLATLLIGWQGASRLAQAVERWRG